MEMNFPQKHFSSDLSSDLQRKRLASGQIHERASAHYTKCCQCSFDLGIQIFQSSGEFCIAQEMASIAVGSETVGLFGNFNELATKTSTPFRSDRVDRQDSLTNPDNVSILSCKSLGTMIVSPGLDAAASTIGLRT